MAFSNALTKKSSVEIALSELDDHSPGTYVDIPSWAQRAHLRAILDSCDKDNFAPSFFCVHPSGSALGNKFLKLLGLDINRNTLDYFFNNTDSFDDNNELDDEQRKRYLKTLNTNDSWCDLLATDRLPRESVMRAFLERHHEITPNPTQKTQLKADANIAKETNSKKRSVPGELFSGSAATENKRAKTS